jgi:hypothetical protein
MCIFENCKTRPIFNYQNEKKGIYCSSHKLDGMINVRSKTCINPNCKKIPTFNYHNEKTAIYCSSHKLDEMINVRSKTCINPNCKKKPNFNYQNEKTAIYCFTHKLDGMIDVKSKTCIYLNCKKKPNFNYENEKKLIYCSSHKLDGMIDVRSKTCINPNCKIIPNFNYENEKKPIYCFTHKLDGMIDVKSKTCKTYLCYTRVTEKYDGYCLYCYINLFPDKPVTRNYKTKEYSVVECVKEKYPNLSWISDKTIKDGCSKRRPDLLLDLGYQVLIIEIDENQHIDYDCSCENKRIMELSQDLNHRPIIFIRFNPDDYLIKDKMITIKKFVLILNYR